MKVEFIINFESQIENLHNGKLKNEIDNAVRTVMEAHTLQDIPKLKNYLDLKQHSEPVPAITE